MDFWEFVWGSILIMAYVALLFTWFFAALDLFRRRDLSGWMKALWLLIILFLPIFGLLLYFIVRPVEADSYAYSSGYAMDPYASGQMQEMEMLGRLRSQGTITEAEFAQMKARVLTETPGTPRPA
jgi:hypothetical protein